MFAHTLNQPQNAVINVAEGLRPRRYGVGNPSLWVRLNERCFNLFAPDFIGDSPGYNIVKRFAPECCGPQRAFRQSMRKFQYAIVCGPMTKNAVEINEQGFVSWRPIKIHNARGTYANHRLRRR